MQQGGISLYQVSKANSTNLLRNLFFLNGPLINPKLSIHDAAFARIPQLLYFLQIVFRMTAPSVFLAILMAFTRCAAENAFV